MCVESSPVLSFRHGVAREMREAKKKMQERLPKGRKCGKCGRDTRKNSHPHAEAAVLCVVRCVEAVLVAPGGAIAELPDEGRASLEDPAGGLLSEQSLSRFDGITWNEKDTDFLFYGLRHVLRKCSENSNKCWQCLLEFG